MSKEIEFEVKNLLTRKSPGPGGFTGESYQIFEELTPIILISSKKLKRRVHFQIHFIKLALPWYQSQIEYYKKRKLQVDIPDEYRCKNFSSKWKITNKISNEKLLIKY